MRVFAKITAIVILRPAVDSAAHVHGMIAPLPHKAAAVPVMAVEELEIVLQIAGAVSHGVAVFAQDIGLGIFPVSEVLLHFLQTGIHAAEQVRVQLSF